MDFLEAKCEVLGQLYRRGSAEVRTGYWDRYTVWEACCEALVEYEKTMNYTGMVREFTDNDNGYIVRVVPLQKDMIK